MKTSGPRVIKALADLGLLDEPELTPEQEQLLLNALDPEEERLSNILDLYKTNGEDG